jgi:hypothetical protein
MCVEYADAPSRCVRMPVWIGFLVHLGSHKMKNVLLGLVLLICSSAAFAQNPDYRRPNQGADVYVNPYTRQDGTQVQGHYRSAPNDTTLDNWTTRGNVNPYTLEPGHRDPYATPEPTYRYDNNGNTEPSLHHRRN